MCIDVRFRDGAFIGGFYCPFCATTASFLFSIKKDEYPCLLMSVFYIMQKSIKKRVEQIVNELFAKNVGFICSSVLDDEAKSLNGS